MVKCFISELRRLGNVPPSEPKMASEPFKSGEAILVTRGFEESQNPQQLNFPDRLKETACVAWLVKVASSLGQESGIGYLHLVACGQATRCDVIFQHHGK